MLHATRQPLQKSSMDLRERVWAVGAEIVEQRPEVPRTAKTRAPNSGMSDS